MGIFDQSQLKSLIPSGLEKSDQHQSPKKIKRTPMRILIALLLQNPELIELVPSLAALKTLDEPGFDLFEKLTALCREKVGITTGQILEYWRDTEFSRPLEILAIWDHSIDDDDKVEETFRETLKYLYLQFVSTILTLIAKDRLQGLTLEEKQQLARIAQ